MSAFIRSAKWFYHEFGLNAIHETGRNAYLIIFARSFRMIAHGANSLILGKYTIGCQLQFYMLIVVRSAFPIKPRVSGLSNWLVHDTDVNWRCVSWRIPYAHCRSVGETESAAIRIVVDGYERIDLRICRELLAIVDHGGSGCYKYNGRRLRTISID